MKNDEIFSEARKYIPGGVNSPVRAFKSVGMTPRFISRAEGDRIWDVEGKEYIDYVCSWGPLVLGHRHEATLEAIKEALDRGWTYGAPTAIEVSLAEVVCRLIPSIDSVRMVNSGTEATMSALRLARAHTGRNMVVKFEGCYHGHADSFLARAGSGLATLSIPSSPGVPPGTARDTILCPYNDLESVERVCRERAEEIACIIVEPVAGNMGVVPPRAGFLAGLRRVCDEIGALLIFDEVITGFRLAPGGAQELYGVHPDLTTLGKILGGGFPVGAYGGRRKIMEKMAPVGPVYQAGTLSGNPVAMTAGYATLSILAEGNIYQELEEKGAWVERELGNIIADLDLPLRLNRVGSMFTLFFTREQVIGFESALTADTDLYGRFFRLMLAEGVYLAPSQFEACFLSLAHSRQSLNRTLEAAWKSLRSLSNP